MKTTINIHEKNPIADIQEHVVFAANGNVIFCYSIDYPEIFSLSEKYFDEIHTTWTQALKNLPSGTVVHKQDIFLKEKYTAQALSESSFLSKATHDYFKGREYINHSGYLFITYTQNKALNNPKLVNPFTKFQANTVTALDNNLKEFSTHVDDVANYINNSRIFKVHPLDKDTISRLSFFYMNGFQDDVLTDTVLEKDITIGDDYFEFLTVQHEMDFLGDVASCSVDKKFSTDDFSFHQGFIDEFGIKLFANHIVNQIIYLDDKQRWRNFLDKKREELSKARNFGSLNEVMLKRVETVIDFINKDDNARIIRGNLNIMYWDKERNELEKTASKIKSLFKDIDIIPNYPKGVEKINYFLNNHFCFSSHLGNLYVMDLKSALCMSIQSSNYKSDDVGIVFNDRLYNLPVLKDVWDEEKKRIKARNFAVFAPTGEGKSFLANHVLRQFYEDGVRLAIIDLGGSYTKLSLLYPNDCIIIRYESGKSLGINPFYITGDETVTPAFIEDLSVFLFELYLPQKIAEKEQEVALKKIIKTYYEHVTNNHGLPGFYYFIKDNKAVLLEELEILDKYFVLDDFLHVMSEYVEGGLYAFLFEQTEDTSYQFEDKKIVVFELDDVQDNKELLAVMLKLIKVAISRTIWKNKSEKGIILFDEFAKQLKFPNVLSSVEFYYQAIRKQEGAIGIILQSVNQLPQNDTSASILENTQVIYSLYNEKGYDSLQERLKLSSHDLIQLKSLRSSREGEQKYTEIFIKIGKQSNVFRLEVPKEVFAAYLTDGADYEQMMQHYAETQDMEKTIKEFVNQ